MKSLTFKASAFAAALLSAQAADAGLFGCFGCRSDRVEIDYEYEGPGLVMPISTGRLERDFVDRDRDVVYVREVSRDRDFDRGCSAPDRDRDVVYVREVSRDRDCDRGCSAPDRDFDRDCGSSRDTAADTDADITTIVRGVVAGLKGVGGQGVTAEPCGATSAEIADLRKEMIAGFQDVNTEILKVRDYVDARTGAKPAPVTENDLLEVMNAVRGDMAKIRADLSSIKAEQSRIKSHVGMTGSAPASIPPVRNNRPRDPGTR